MARLAAGCSAVAAIAWLGASAGAAPDVIVGDLMEVTSYGTANGKAVWAVGTTSCNLGDTPLTWIETNNQHPVISQNIYRLANGRFEQIGQAWLKHGFCALQGTVCSPCTPGGSCPALFPGCSDPYSAGLNGSQGGLGPKFEVNAATGVFPYPFTGDGTIGGTDFKRLQASTADLGTAGALYFVSSTYIQPEDAAANNDNNNQSYRRVTIGASPSYTMATADTTARGLAAINAWRDYGGGIGVNDPSVQLTNVDVANDGRFMLGCKVTPIVGGYHFEYAVYNHNSDRSGQSFSIPLPPGAVVTNVGFHDVDYHSGEPYSGTDWTSSVTSSAVTWSTQTHATNANANALRWDTIYNFRFDCNFGPVTGNATIGLFKPGTPTSVNIVASVPDPAGVIGPANDLCANAQTVLAGTTSFLTTNANTDGPDECTFNATAAITRDVWFKYTSPCGGPLTIATCGSGFNTKLAVYSGTTCPTTPGLALACNDDNAVCGSGATTSSVNFTAASSTTYLIRVGSPNNTTGSGSLVITDTPCANNDACAGAIALTKNVVTTGTTVGATNDGTATCGQSTTSPDRWYSYTPTVSGTIGINTCNSGYDTVLSAYTGNCGSLTQVVCNDDSYNGGNNACGTNNLSSGFNLVVTAGTRYLFRVAGYQGNVGAFNILVTDNNSAPTPPQNDNCSGRIGIPLGDTPIDTTNATTDGPVHASCLFFGNNQITKDVWYNHPAQANGTLTVSTCGIAGFDTKIAVYNGSGCTDFESRLMTCDDDTAGCATNTTSVSVPVVNGTSYTIRVGGFNNAAGTGTLRLSFVPDPPACVADVDDGSGTGTPDGGVTIDDLIYYLGLFEAGNIDADVDDGSGTGTPDGGVTIDDLIYYLTRFEAGC